MGTALPEAETVGAEVLREELGLGAVTRAEGRAVGAEGPEVSWDCGVS